MATGTGSPGQKPPLNWIFYGPISTAGATPTDGPETRCTLYRTKYCAGDMIPWSKRSGEANKEHCQKCPRREVPEEKSRGW